MVDNEYLEVRFDEHCKTCHYEKLPETKDPCNYCLDHPINSYSTKPVSWKEKESSK